MHKFKKASHQEEVVWFWREATVLEEAKEVVVLAVNVTYKKVGQNWIKLCLHKKPVWLLYNTYPNYQIDRKIKTKHQNFKSVC